MTKQHIEVSKAHMMCVKPHNAWQHMHTVHSMAHMHDECFGLNFGKEGDVGEYICPSRPFVHVGAQTAHACTHKQTA